MSLEGRRFEIPARFRHLERVTVRFARWDLARVYIVDPNLDRVLDRLYPLDRSQNADGLRRRLPSRGTTEPTAHSGEVAPLLKKLLRDYAATGLPPGYLPLNRKEEE